MANTQNKKKVLVVDDDFGLRKILIERLKELGLETLSAETGQNAVYLIKKERPNLVLLDIMLPGGMNGFDVLEQLKKNELLKTIPVIVLTNLDTEMKTALDIGAIDYIVKAETPLDEVILKVKNHLQV